MNWDMIIGLLRHGLTFGGGVLVAKGKITEADAQSLIGAAITVAGVIASLINKKKPA